MTVDKKYLLSEADIIIIRKRLVDWYNINRRKLPWRGDEIDGYPPPPPCSEYGTWISEVMLQQTRVETVISYWFNWMKIFPTVSALAAASLDDVNAVWAGLGYYRRAKQLLEAAQVIMDKYDGCLPRTSEELLKIPGIGPYTAGAILSIAHNLPECAVDGNVMRVLSRLRAISIPVGSKLEKVSRVIAQDLVDPSQPGAFNQALMELGATVCKPVNPNCDNCPLHRMCIAQKLCGVEQEGAEIDIEDADNAFCISSVTAFPVKAPRKPPVDVRFIISVVCVRSGNISSNVPNLRFLFVRRPTTGLLAGQWEFPSLQISDIDTSPNWCSALSTLQSVFGIIFTGLPDDMQVEDSKCCPEYKTKYDSSKRFPVLEVRRFDSPLVHIFSHQRHLMHLFVIYVDAGALQAKVRRSLQDQWSGAFADGEREARWLEELDAKKYGLTTGVKKILNHVRDSKSRALQKRKRNSSN